MQLEKLLEEDESEYLDFKQKWYEDTGCLILDILCMANSDTQSDRYIVIGYSEKERNFCDISEYRFNQDNLCILLSTSNFNRIPLVKIQTLSIAGNEIDIIVIKKAQTDPIFY